MMDSTTRSAWTTHSDPAAAFAEISRQIGESRPVVILIFAPPDNDGITLSRLLSEHYGCAVAGCTTAGELSDHAVQERGYSVMALGSDKVRRAAGAVAEFTEDVGQSVGAAVEQLARSLEIDVRKADSARYAGIVLIDGLSQKEEEVNHALGIAAPGLLFVGGSAGDDLRFQATSVFLNGQASSRGGGFACARRSLAGVILGL